jgi:hypothetical protein
VAANKPQQVRIVIADDHLLIRDAPSYPNVKCWTSDKRFREEIYFHQVVDTSGWESPVEYRRAGYSLIKLRFPILDHGLVRARSSKLRPAIN